MNLRPSANRLPPSNPVILNLLEHTDHFKNLMKSMDSLSQKQSNKHNFVFNVYNVLQLLRFHYLLHEVILNFEGNDPIKYTHYLFIRKSVPNISVVLSAPHVPPEIHELRLKTQFQSNDNVSKHTNEDRHLYRLKRIQTGIHENV